MKSNLHNPIPNWLTALMLMVIVGSHAHASSMTYQLTVLGQADNGLAGSIESGYADFYTNRNPAPKNDPPSTNYLNYLNPSDQASFKSGSFDAWAHPATSSLNVGGYYESSNDQHGSSQGWHDSPFAISTNNLGQVVGVSLHLGYATGFVYDPNVPAPSWQGSDPAAGTFSGAGTSPNSKAMAINDHGQIVGLSFGMSSTPNAHPFLGSQTVADPTQTGSSLALNNNGQVVGWILDPTGTSHAFFFNGSAVQDLNDLIPGTSHFVLNVATGIDANGQIAGFGTAEDGTVHAFLLTPEPVPEPSTLAFAGCVAFAAFLKRRFTRSAKPIRFLP